MTLCETMNKQQAEDGCLIDPEAHPRYMSSGMPTLRFLVRPSLECHSAIVKEVSKIDIGLLVVRPFQPGTRLALMLDRKAVGLSGLLAAAVGHCTAHPEGGWLLGCALSRNLTDHELLALL